MSSIFLDRSVSKNKKLQTTDSFITSDPSTSFITSDEPVEKSNNINKKYSIFTERKDGTLVGVQPILDNRVSHEHSGIAAAQ